LGGFLDPNFFIFSLSDPVFLEHRFLKIFFGLFLLINPAESSWQVSRAFFNQFKIAQQGGKYLDLHFSLHSTKAEKQIEGGIQGIQLSGLSDQACKGVAFQRTYRVEVSH